MSKRRLHRWAQVMGDDYLRQGREWYTLAGFEVRRLSDDYGLEFGLVAGVIAVLSPSVYWEQNLTDAEKVIRSFLYAEQSEWQSTRVSTYRRNRDKAFSILHEGKVFPHLNGAKVVPFYYNLCGDYTPVTIDSHALNAWAGYRLAGSSLPTPSVHARRQAAKDYRHVARKVGVTPAHLQAAVWLFWKDRIEEGRVEGYEK